MSGSILNQIRDEILPMVWGAQTEDVVLNVYIEEKYDALIIAGRNDKLNRELGFAITHAGIVDGVYKTVLPQALRQLVHMLECSSEDEYFTTPPAQDPGSWRIH